MKVKIEDPPPVMVTQIPEVQVTAMPPKKSYGNAGMLAAALAVAGGTAFYMYRKNK